MKEQDQTGSTAKTIRKLEEENSRLLHLAETDWLTGLYNRGAMELRINAHLRQKKQGSMIVMDLDYFKRVNDHYGHIIGDQLLQNISIVLKKLFPGNCLIGRVGGDEFAIFFLDTLPESELNEKSVRIQARFREVQLQNQLLIRLSVTTAWADCQSGLNYRVMFDSADQQIVEKKRIRNSKKNKTYKESLEEPTGIRLDMRLIAGEMREIATSEGAYCQDYETFKKLCQLELRRMHRKQKDIYLILFTLTDKDNDFLSLEQRDAEMNLLGQEVQHNLRQSDVFTQYSSNQYLVMVSDLTAEHVEIIADRIRQAYYKNHEGETGNVMLHRSYPLKP